MKLFRLFAFLPLAALLAFGATGCSSKPKPNPRIATEVEETFKQGWIAKRMNELQATGKDARDSRRIATEEFAQKYAYTTIAKQPNPSSGVIP